MSSTPIDYRTQIAAQVEQNAAEQKAAANEAAWQEIINRYVIKDHAANRQMVESWSGNEITLAKFKLLADNPPAGFQLDWSDEKTLRAELIEAILQQLHDPTEHRFTDSAAKAERVKMGAWTLRMLRSHLNEIVRRQHFNQFSAPELRAASTAVVREATSKKFFTGSDGARYENLPSVLVPKGFVQAISTSEFLKHIARHDVEAFKHYVKRYGSEQVNLFLNI